ncbi:MAG: ABC transporter substrate-binding protein [Patescibacteria group bacterium]|nr:ABC transporter substrate-binding protein [Patescibacteria group bacterium]
MKTGTIILVIAIVILAAVGIWYGVVKKPVSAPESKEPIKIGFFAPLTGGGAPYGQSEKNAVEMAVEKINAAGGINGRLISVIYEDGKCDGKEAVTAIQKLISVDNVKVVLGGACSAETLGAAPIAEQNKVILFSAFSSSPDITNAGDFIFRNSPSDLDGGKVVAQMIKEKSVAMITENTDYSIGVRKVTKDEFEKLGGKIAADEVYAPEAKDFKTYLVKIKDTNPEAIFVNPGTSASGAGLLIKQIKELGIKTVIYGNFIVGSPDSLKIAGVAAEGAVFYDAPGLSPTNPKAVAFLDEFKAKYSAPASDFEVGARYDSVFIVADGLKKCGEDTECLRDHFYSVKDYDGVLGKYGFDQNGDVVGLSVAVKEIKDGVVVERK